MNNDIVLSVYNDFLNRILPHLKTSNLFNRYSSDYQNFKNPLVDCGAKVFSQSDEDGITFEILRRLGIKKGTFLEFGVGNGLENNTLSLLACDWKGLWFGTGQQLGFNYNPKNLPKTDLNFIVTDSWITKDNILPLVKDGMSNIRCDNFDVISMDLDGNDYYFVEQLLESNLTPELFIVEYNAKFIPPIEFIVNYDDSFSWKGDDYYGASLQSFVNLFSKYGYCLVACNLSGANAFFVKQSNFDKFPDIPREISKLYNSPKWFLCSLDVWGNWNTIDGANQTVLQIISKVNSGEKW